MSADGSSAIDQTAAVNILVIGDALMEVTISGSSERLCREAPVPIVDVQSVDCLPLGAAAVAAELAALGAHTTLLSVTGDDDDGELLRSVEGNQGIDLSLAVEPGRRMTARHRVVAGSQMLLRFDTSCREPVLAATEAGLVRLLEACVPEADCVVLVEPWQEVCSPLVASALAEVVAAHGKDVVVKGEAPDFLQSAPRFAARGDHRSIALAAIAAARGESFVSAPEWREDGAVASEVAPEKLLTLDNVARLAQLWRGDGRKVVFTNGCFDILHSGHVSLLKRARQFGDLLIVGLNTDESVRLLKGPERPVNSLPDRVEVLAALACVDYVVPFAEQTPSSLIRVLRPHVFVKGGDYEETTLPEAPLVRQLGGRVEILGLVPDHSTTAIIQRIWSERAPAAAATKAMA